MSGISLQQHVYTAFLAGNTADVELSVSGSWHAVYRLHRVVLIQSDFFESLFTSGFSESSRRSQVDVSFDDYNITRPAFELCIARLYGGGPPLHISPNLIPTREHPLTPHFPKHYPSDPPPPGHHPATPRFLLSLLATSIYLSIPSIVSECLSLVLSSFGPTTIIPYLDFALGKPLPEPQTWEPEAAVTLESLAQVAPPDTPTSEAEIESLASSADECSKLGAIQPPSIQASKQPTVNYGAVSSRIGEAAACWLTRWAQDIFVLESKHASNQTAARSSSWEPISAKRPRAQTMSAIDDRHPTTDPAVLAESLPVIWGRGGLSAGWVRALLSSDALFIKSEKERYHFSRAVVEFRRRHGVIVEEEEEWQKLFAQGIYYSNMHTDDIILIAEDKSLVTGKPFVPLDVLQRALWEQAVLRRSITAKSHSGSGQPESRDKELGITVSTATILSRLSASADEELKHTPYWRVPVDKSSRLGDGGTPEGSSMEQIFQMSQSSKSSSVPNSEKNFFGLLSDMRVAADTIEDDPTGKATWSPHPPFRFSVEFWDVEYLKEKSRLHSQTISYAGSYFNVYVQVVKKKGVQLGVYLHRQSSVDPIPPSSIPYQPAPPNPFRDSDQPHTPGPSFPSLSRPSSSPTIHYSPSIHPAPPSRSTTPHAAPGSPTGSSSVTSISGSFSTRPATASPVAPLQQYRDPRPAIMAFFTINCASSTGSSLSRFSSAPDIFSVSQSWGWKSSSVRTEDYMDISPPPDPKTRGKEVSLRATVILGLI